MRVRIILWAISFGAFSFVFFNLVTSLSPGLSFWNALLELAKPEKFSTVLFGIGFISILFSGYALLNLISGSGAKLAAKGYNQRLAIYSLFMSVAAITAACYLGDARRPDVISSSTDDAPHLIQTSTHRQRMNAGQSDQVPL